MANPEHLYILRRGVDEWNQCRIEYDVTKPDFIDANLSYANLIGADFTSADLRGANLSYASLIGADLTSANLIDANLRSASLSRADLSHADLRSTSLSYTNLSDAKLQAANLAGAEIVWSIFADNDLSAILGLELVLHRGPATIGVDTLVKSKGQIPESFLRGCGLSDWQLEEAKLYNPDLSNEQINDIQYRIHDLRVRRAFQINPLFISYSHADSIFVDTIESHLINQGIRFWRDIHDAKAGKLERQIDAAIHLNDVVLLVLSKDSTNSDWVEHEVRKAREKEKQSGKDALCPVALDDSWKTCRWPERLREQIMEYNILDFANWHDASHFQTMFNRLLEGLNLFYK